MRIGIGYDIHRLVSGRELWLGGVLIPSDVGLLGHSDADALIHAIIRAIAGAAALPDIGQHFPDTDPANKNINSAHMLAEYSNMLKKNDFDVMNIDTFIIAQRPKLSPYYDAMRRNIATILCVDAGQIGVKATTNEGLDAAGQGLAIAVHAVALLQRR